MTRECRIQPLKQFPSPTEDKFRLNGMRMCEQRLQAMRQEHVQLLQWKTGRFKLESIPFRSHLDDYIVSTRPDCGSSATAVRLCSDRADLFKLYVCG